MKINCAYCGRETEKHPCEIKKRNYCSTKCFDNFRKSNPDICSPKTFRVVCETCGKEFKREKWAIRGHVYCSSSCFGKSILTDGYINDSGYKIIRVNGRRMREHRYFMERKIGRPLLENEMIHHIDHDKTNNDLSNLMIVTRQEHGKIHLRSPETKSKMSESQKKRYR